VAAPAPLVSAVVAAYNYDRYLVEALDSALAQDWPADRLELVVVDDGSTDRTPEVAQRYAREHPGRIRYIRQDNAGLAAATTRGLREARGELITLLDADDVWTTSRTRLLVDALARNPRAGLVYGDMQVIDGDGRTVAESWLREARQTPYRGLVAAHLLRSNFVIAPSLMVRASLKDRICPIPSFFPAQDWYIAARVAEVGEVDFVPAAVAGYRRHGANMSHGKDTAADVAKLFRRDVGMRRWMLGNLRAAELTVEDLAGGYDYFWQTLLFVARAENVAPESLVEVSAEDLGRAADQLRAGRAALSRAAFVAAAGHFLAALASDPFDACARDALDHARRRLVVPEPRRASVRSGTAPAPDYHLKPGYTSRTAPHYFVDLRAERDGVVLQPDVYARAAEVAARLAATRIVDIGAGAGGKLVALSSRFDILALDYGPNVELARRRFPAFAWREHDLDGADALPLTPEQLTGAVVICANVLEHLVHPERLLENLRGLLPSIEALVISTPDRDLTSGPDDFGPPADLTRVREWSVQEFAELLEGWGFEHGDLGLTRSDNAGGAHTTILATLFPDAKRAAHLAVPDSVAA
jgi:glycosyltransferase involved in cell wall biosynthesis/SAM-dependent methyltransferase